MAQGRSDFRELERTNHRETVELVVVFLVLFCALGFGLDFVIGTVRIVDGHFVGFPVLTIAALIIGLIQSVASYYGGAGLVLASVHASPLMPDSPNHQIVLDVVQEMAVAAQMPVPRAYIIDDEAPNAFATGRDPQHSVICVTQGLVDTMDREELQGVLGHEMAHIRDYDIRTMMMIAVLVGGVAMLADFVRRWMWYGGFGGGIGGGGRRGGSREEGGNAGALIAIAVLVLAVLAPIFSQLIAMAVSRQREYLADAASVEFTRNPRALLRALERIAQVESPLKTASRGVAHLFIVNPLEGAQEDDEGLLDNLLSTHPPLGRRIARLHALLGEAPQAAPDAVAVAQSANVSQSSSSSSGIFLWIVLGVALGTIVAALVVLLQ
jgi:heat shock protein HtpX